MHQNPAKLASLLFLFLASSTVAQGLPDQVLVGYWHNWGNASAGVPLRAVTPAYDVVNVAFATPTVPFGATMQFVPDASIYSTPASFTADVRALQTRGTKVLISIGGANDPVHLDDAQDVQAFVTSLRGIVSTFGFDGLDIDLESGSLQLDAGDRDFTRPTTPRIVNLITAVRQLRQNFGPSFLITTAPETALLQGAYSAYAGIWGAYLPVVHGLRDLLAFVQTQHYNTGSMFGRDGRVYQPATADFHLAMADMLISGFPVAGGASFPPLRADQVVIGLPASTSAAGSGYTQPGVVHAALDTMILGRPTPGTYALVDPAGHPSMRGLMTWSIQWDVQANHGFSSPHRSYLDDLFLAMDRTTIQGDQGGHVTFTLRAGRANAGRFYFLLGSLSGTSPGVLLPGGRSFALQPDALTWLILDPAAASVFQGFLGTFDGAGDATPQLHLPALPGSAGAVAHFAAFVSSPYDFTTPPQSLTFL